LSCKLRIFGQSTSGAVVTFLAQLVSNTNEYQPLIDIQIKKAAGFAPEPAASCAVLLE
jgi:hypothetical protein